MRPKKHKTTGSNDLFRARLDQIINMKHELILLAGKIDWDWIDREIAPALQRARAAGDRDPLHDRAAVAQAHLRAVRRGGVRALGPRPIFPVLHWRGVLPARIPARAFGPEPLAQAARRQAGAVIGREPASGARSRCVAQ